MKVETQELSDSEVALTLEVDDARLERAMDAAYRRAANRVKIAGFRPGKAPRSLVERVVGHEVLLEDALNALLPEVYQEAVRDTDLRVLTEPEFDVESVSPLRAKARVVVQPPVELGDYRAIRRELPPIDVSEEEMDEVLQSLRERHAEWVPVDRGAQLGDRVAIDVLGTAEGETVLDREDVDYVLDAEMKFPVPEFAPALVGIGAGEERSFELSVPAENEGELAGKTISFRVTAKEVKEKELPELDDYFAATVGSFKDLAELRARVREDVREREEHSAKEKHEQEVVAQAVESSRLSIPEKIIDREVERLRDRLARDLDRRGLSIEQYQRIVRSDDSALTQEMREQAERALRRSFVLRAIAEQEEISVPEDEVDERIRAALRSDGSDERSVARALRQAEVRERVRLALSEERASKWLVEQATVAPRADASDVDPEGGN